MFGPARKFVDSQLNPMAASEKRLAKWSSELWGRFSIQLNSIQAYTLHLVVFCFLHTKNSLFGIRRGVQEVVMEKVFVSGGAPAMKDVTAISAMRDGP
jgi:hypothetical protein